MLVQISKGSISFGTEDVFEDIDFLVNENEKVAIIGKNGCGKSTLLKVILGQEELSKGEIYKASDITIGYLKQNAFTDERHSAKEELLEVFKDVIKMEKELEELAERLKDDHDQAVIDRYAALQSRFEYAGGYTYQSDIESVFCGFGFNVDDIDRPLDSFSGGEKTKISFAKLLLQKADLLLLDEPTNHLDLKTIEWLENYLANYPKAIVLVSHDRAFLDKTVGIIYEIEYGHMTKYHGNYSKYQIDKKNNIERQSKLYQYQQKDIKRLEDLIQKYRYKATKAKMVQSKIKFLDRMEKIEDPKKADTKTFKAKFRCKVKGGKSVLSLDHYAYGYDKKLGEVTLEIERGQRICIMGDNGTGKSTLLKTIVDELPALGGYKLFGHQIEVGYFDQTLTALKSHKTIIDEIWDEYPELDNFEVRSLLGTFLFSSDEVLKTLDVLSGGERVRLALAKLMLKEANFLILDEPTNHLDIPSKEALEEALKDYDGTILFVSHDRYFIKNIADSILLLNNGSATFYPDGYKDYIDERKENIKEEKKEVKKEIVKEERKPRLNLKKIEAKIAELEEELEAKRELRYEPEYYQDALKMQSLDEEIDEIHNLIHHEMEKWEEAMLIEEKKNKKN